MAQRTMRLGLFINPTGHHQAAWRHPDADADAGVSFAHYSALAQTAERAGFDAIFLADNQCVRSGPPEAVSRVAQYVANFEPLTLLSALSVVTERIGLIATASTSYNYPFQIARKFASIDHISGGRVGWNMVTSGIPGEAPNFGLEVGYEHDDRYLRADEVVRVCLGLWDSWEDDAFPRDKSSGVFAELEKLHSLEHDGRYVRVRGPLNVPRSPQGYPVLVQAGQSEAGRTFAAKHAEVMFTTPQSIERGRELYGEMRERVAALGRDPELFVQMPGLVVITGRTASQAQERFDQLQGYLHPAVALNILSFKLGMGQMDLSGYALDEPLPASAEPAGEKSAFWRWMEIAQREQLTLRELALRASGSLAGMQVVGSYVEIADLMEEWFRGGAADGFNVQPAYLPGMLEEFAQLVVPELRRRGIARERYEGRTLREHFGLPRPAWGERSGRAVPA
jgi:N-acetyl-S-(2-succino)cysteine monooxygenase